MSDREVGSDKDSAGAELVVADVEPKLKPVLAEVVGATEDVGSKRALAVVAADDKLATGAGILNPPDIAVVAVAVVGKAAGADETARKR